MGIIPILQMTYSGSERLGNLPKLIQVAHLNTNLSCFRAHTISTRHTVSYRRWDLDHFLRKHVLDETISSGGR